MVKHFMSKRRQLQACLSVFIIVSICVIYLRTWHSKPLGAESVVQDSKPKTSDSQGHPAQSPKPALPDDLDEPVRKPLNNLTLPFSLDVCNNLPDPAKKCSEDDDTETGGECAWPWYRDNPLFESPIPPKNRIPIDASRGFIKDGRWAPCDRRWYQHAPETEARNQCIFTIGDSVDRFNIYAWCMRSGGQTEDYDKEKKLPYVNGGSIACRGPKNSMGFLQVFGSSPVSPYINYEGDTGLAAYSVAGIYNTSERIVSALNMFAASNCEPTAIVYQVNFWDSRGLGRIQASVHADEGTPSLPDSADRCDPAMSVFNDVPDTYYNNTLIELGIIKKWIADRKSSAVVLMRTSSYFPESYNAANSTASIQNYGMYFFAEELNKQIVDIGIRHGVHVIDWRRFILMNPESHGSFLGDLHHPTEDYSVQFVELLMKAIQIVRRYPKVLLVSDRCR